MGKAGRSTQHEIITVDVHRLINMSGLLVVPVSPSRPQETVSNTHRDVDACPPHSKPGSIGHRVTNQGKYRTICICI